MGRANAERDLYAMFGFADAEPISGVVQDIVADPATSEWLRLALTDSMNRDPVDAANDAETLASVLTMRAEVMLRKGAGLRRSG